MANMSYCRFRNTAISLEDCLDSWDSLDENETEEKSARDSILKMAIGIIENYTDYSIVENSGKLLY